jgi:hypothetical protein
MEVRKKLTPSQVLFSEKVTKNKKKLISLIFRQSAANPFGIKLNQEA